MSLFAAIVLTALVAPLYQATPISAQPQLQPQTATPASRSNGTTATVPQQIRRAEPPSPEMSEPQLEVRGDALREEKAYADALDFYHAAMHKQDSAVLHDKAGIADLMMYRQDEAQKEFKHAVKMDKNYPEAYNNLGVIQYQRKKFGKAIKFYEKAIKLNDDSAAFHSNMGTAYFAEKHYDEALTEYRHALQLDPDIFESHPQGGVSLRLADSTDLGHYDYVIAKMYATAGKPDLSIHYLQKALEEGYPQIQDVYKDPEFTAVRKDPRFASLMRAKPPAITN